VLTWTQQVSASPPSRRGGSTVLLVAFGLASLVGTLAVLVGMFQTGLSSGEATDLAQWIPFVLLASQIFWLWMLIDAIVSDVRGSRVVWVLSIVFFGNLGAMLYLIFGRSRH
jgi:phospholipase D-like protein